MALLRRRAYLASCFFLARCLAVSVDDPAGAKDEAPQHQRIAM